MVKSGDLIVIDDTGVAVIPFERLHEIMDQAEALESRDDAKAEEVRKQTRSAI